jgi:hypothetical protein
MDDLPAGDGFPHALLKRRKLNSKSKLESSLPHFSFKVLKPGRRISRVASDVITEQGIDTGVQSVTRSPMIS